MNMVYSFFQSLLKSPAGVGLLVTLLCLLQNKAANSATAFQHHSHQRHHHISYAPHQRRAVVRTTTTARQQLSTSLSSWLFPTFTKQASSRKQRGTKASKERLLELIVTSATEASVTTTEILDLVQEIEATAAEKEKRVTAQEILNKLQGQWELLWTVQDPESINVLEKQGKGGSRLNLLENQRPKVVNNQLDNNKNNKSQGGGGGGLQVLQTLASLVKTNNKKETKKAPRRSTQEISIEQQQVRNVAYYSNVFGDDDASITVDIDFQPHGDDADPRRVDAEFTSCRVVVPYTPIDFSLPLQVFGGRPRGWLRTTYVDDDFRITRGHKGSIFILCRPALLLLLAQESSLFAS